MKYAISILGSPYSDQACGTAYRFVNALLERGHEVYRVFFYHDGVLSGTRLGVPPQDEHDMSRLWTRLAEEHGTDLVLCVASALRRGILDPREAERYGLDADNIADGFTLSGLGQLIDAGLNADRLITFGP